MRTRLRAWRSAAALAAALAATAAPAARGVTRLTDDTDRAAFRAWFTFLADTEFERPSPDVTDCAALVRHAYREALRGHSPEWYRRTRLPMPVALPDVRRGPAPSGGG